MSKKQTVKVMVEGGAATAGPPIGPALGPMGVNAAKVVEEINKITAPFKGMKVPVEVIIDSATKQFELVIGSPPTSALILKAVGLEKAGGGRDMVGDISLEQIIEIAKSKRGSILANSLKASAKEVIGVARSMKLTIEGRTCEEMTQEIADGKHDDKLAE